MQAIDPTMVLTMPLRAHHDFPIRSSAARTGGSPVAASIERRAILLERGDWLTALATACAALIMTKRSLRHTTLGDHARCP
jgi:hypothetical protein